MSNFPSSLPVSSSKLHPSKRQPLTEPPIQSPINSRKSIVSEETKRLPRSSSIPLRIALTSSKSISGISSLRTSPSRKKHDNENSAETYSLRTSAKSPRKSRPSSSVMNPTAASAQRSRKPSSVLPLSNSHAKSSRLSSNSRTTSPKNRTSSLQRNPSTNPTLRKKISALSKEQHKSERSQRQSLPAIAHSPSYPLLREGREERRNTILPSQSMSNLSKVETLSTSEISPRRKTARFTQLTSTGQNETAPSERKAGRDEVKGIGKDTFYYAKPSSPSTARGPSERNVSFQSSVKPSLGPEIKTHDQYRDNKYPDFPKDPLSSVRELPSAPKVSAERPSPLRTPARKLPIPPDEKEQESKKNMKPRVSEISTTHSSLSPVSVKRRSTIASSQKSAQATKPLNPYSASNPKSQHLSHLRYELDKHVPKSQTLGDIQETFALHSKPKKAVIEDPSKSPYRPLNRPAHVYPQSNKKPAHLEENTEKRVPIKMRSKSTAAKQWTTISTSLNSGTKKPMFSPLSARAAGEGRRVVSNNRVESPLEARDSMTENEKQIQAIMRSLVRKIPDESPLARKYEDSLKVRKAAKEPMTPSLAARTQHLNMYERGEILDYRNVYFTGGSHVKKISGDIRHASNNFGFDDENGDYKVVPGDHIAYRYEVLSTLGKGSFGKVLKCLDHKNGKLVAVKMIINREQYHMQALIEADILRALSQWVSFYFSLSYFF